MSRGQWRGVVMGLGVLALALLLAGCGVARDQWENIGPENTQINTLAADPHIRGIICAGGSNGLTYVARGDEAGAFVASARSPGKGPVQIIFPNPYTPGAVYAGADGGFFASSDYGENYVEQSSGLPADANVTAITTGAEATTLVINVAQKGIYTSVDGGKSWKPAASASNGKSGPLPARATVQDLLWDSASKALYAAVSGAEQAIYVSHDHGASWSAGDSGLPAKTDAYALLTLAAGGIAPSGPTLYAGTSAGVFALGSSGGKWQSVGAGLPSGTVYSLATYGPTPGLLYASVGKTVYSSRDGGRHWKQIANDLAHTVVAIVNTPGKSVQMVTFVAAGQIARYPGGGGASDSSGLGTIIAVLMVGLAAWYLLAHFKFVPGFNDLRKRLLQRDSQR